MQKFRPLALRSIIAVLIVLIVPAAASARVIGIVFDDSGSMAPRIHLPTFCVQLLASTLDAGSGKDRLLTIRLSQLSGGVVEENIGTPEALQRTVENIRRSWARAHGGTPYAPIELMLQAIVQRLKPEEIGTLVILTDGQIDRPPPFAEMQRAFARLKQELDAKRASIDVEFMLIAVGPDRDVVRRAVNDQRVRAALLEQFNGNRQERDGRLVGEHEVTDIRDLFDNMKKIVARISGTDVARIGAYVSYSNNTVTIDTPLSVTRMVSVVKAVNAEPRNGEARGFRPSQTFRVGSGMDAQDRALPNQVFRSSTEQMSFRPALEPGRHAISFDTPVADNVFLVFETNARVEMTVVDDKGVEARRDQSDAYVLARNRDYRLVEVLVDETAQGRRVVPLSSLTGQTIFTATIDEPGGGRRILPMTIAPAENRAVAAYRPDKLGVFVARGRAQLEGFVSPLSKPVQMKVIEGTLTVQSTVLPSQPCSDCPADTIRSTIGHDAGSVDVATIEITPKGDSPGSAILDVSGVPHGLSLLDQSGNVVAGGAGVNLAPDQPMRFRLVRAARPPPDVVDKTVPLTIRLRGEQTMTGEHTIQRSVSIMVPKVRLTYAGHRGGTDDGDRLIVSGTDLSGAKSSLDFKVENALDPVTPENFKLTSSAWLFGVDWKVAGDRLTAVPAARYWCMCFLWIDRGDHDINVAYSGADGIQNATATATLDVQPTLREIIFGCLALLLLVLGLVWAIGAIFNALAARRFPGDSFMEIDEGQQVSRKVSLRGRNWTFLRALLWPIFGRPDERRVVEGLDLTAGNRLLLLRVGRDSEDLNVRGEWLSERFSVNEKLERLLFNLNWQETVQKKGPPTLSIRCWRSAGDYSRGF